MLALLILTGAVLYDPPRALGLLGPQAQTFGWELQSALGRVLPQIWNVIRR